MSSGQIRRVTEQQDTSKSGILFVVVRTRRAAFSPCCFHRAISPYRDFTKRFHRVAISPSCDFAVCDFAVSRFHRVAISPRCDFAVCDFAVSRFHQAAISPCRDFTVRFHRVAISPSDFTVWQFHRTRFHHVAMSPCCFCILGILVSNRVQEKYPV